MQNTILGQNPAVTVVIPVRNSQRTIQRCVDSLLRQDYAGEVRVLLVGSVGDQTWEPISDLIVADKIRVIESDVVSPRRDANAKRNIGLSHADTPVIALTDSDMVLPPNWVREGVAYMQDGWSCVAGGMISTDSGFWGKYVDTNMLGSKTPRIAEDYVITAANCGKGKYKLPVTANVFITRELYRRVGDLDKRFVYSYEDYEWFERIINAGYNILCATDLAAEHYHRQGFRDLTREYRGSGRGCADFITLFSNSAFAQKRVAQLAAIGVMGVASIAALVYAPLLALLSITALVASVMLLSAGMTRSVRGLIYPLVTVVLSSAFVYGMTFGLFIDRSIKQRVVHIRSITPLHFPSEHKLEA